MAAATILFGEGSFFGTANANPLYAGYAVAGFFASAVWVLPASMLADVADEDELETGMRREGIFFGILNFGEKIAAGFAALTAGALLDTFVLLAPEQTVQAPDTVARLGLVYGVLPAAVLGAAAFVVVGYGLDKKRLAAIQNELGRRRTPVSASAGRSVVE
jgi:GPH family glycoside/pentoside/hexuronide:cation symporter